MSGRVLLSLLAALCLLSPGVAAAAGTFGADITGISYAGTAKVNANMNLNVTVKNLSTYDSGYSGQATFCIKCKLDPPGWWNDFDQTATSAFGYLQTKSVAMPTFSPGTEGEWTITCDVLNNQCSGSAFDTMVGKLTIGKLTCADISGSNGEGCWNPLDGKCWPSDGALGSDVYGCNSVSGLMCWMKESDCASNMRCHDPISPLEGPSCMQCFDNSHCGTNQKCENKVCVSSCVCSNDAACGAGKKCDGCMCINKTCADYPGANGEGCWNVLDGQCFPAANQLGADIYNCTLLDGKLCWVKGTDCPSTQYCDDPALSGPRCVQCQNTAQCGKNQECKDNKCVSTCVCSSDAACGAGKKCDGCMCVEKTCSEMGMNLGSCKDNSAGAQICSGDGTKVLNCKATAGPKCWELVQACPGVCSDPLLGGPRCIPKGDADYCAALVTAGKTCGHGESDCDGDSQCATGLKCMGWPIIGIDGCCYPYETWNGSACLIQEADTVVTGDVSYQDRVETINLDWGTATYTGTRTLKARFVMVELIDAGNKVLASGTTLSNGSFSFIAKKAPVGGQVRIKVYAKTGSSDVTGGMVASAAGLIELKDTWTYLSNPMTIEALKDLKFGTIAIPQNVSGAWNILDMLVEGWRYVSGVASEKVGAVDVWWNTTLSGTYYCPLGLCMNGGGQNVFEWQNIHIAGSASNDDEFSDMTIIHEYAHFVNDEISVICSCTPNQHTWCVESCGADLAWTEGFAYHFALRARQVLGYSVITKPAAIIHNITSYSGVEDSVISDPASPGGNSWSQEVEKVFPSCPKSMKDELSVIQILWDLSDGANENFDAVSGFGDDPVKYVDAFAPGITPPGVMCPFNQPGLCGFYTYVRDKVPAANQASLNEIFQTYKGGICVKGCTATCRTGDKQCGSDGCGGQCLPGCTGAQVCEGGRCIVIPKCGDAACNGTETCLSCAVDCGVCPPNCGDKACNGTETCKSCAVDCGVCPAECGNKVIEPPETCDDGNKFDGDGCSAECKSESCGDGKCLGAENCFLCAVDCGNCCGDGLCQDGFHENCTVCPKDCGVCPEGCGDLQCSPQESCTICPQDCGVCPPECGNNKLEFGEECDDGNKFAGDGCNELCQKETCGDGKCTDAENCFSCVQDCGMCCGNGQCDLWFKEDCLNCEQDCGSCSDGCPDKQCSAGEDCTKCPFDCGLCADCGDAVKDGDEGCDDGNNVSGDGCSAFCKVEVCQDGVCNNGEDCFTCPADCGLCCGNGACEIWLAESCTECQLDCGLCPPDCGNGACGGVETCVNCPGDCGACQAECGNGIPDAGEACDDGNQVSGDGCSEACEKEYCGDGLCGAAELCLTCKADCGICCGNGQCEPWFGEGIDVCPQDCLQGFECGDTRCDPVEDCASCPADCGECACVPDCDGKDCGPDDCGGSCGQCQGSDTCHNGHCGGEDWDVVTDSFDRDFGLEKDHGAEGDGSAYWKDGMQWGGDAAETDLIPVVHGARGGGCSTASNGGGAGVLLALLVLVSCVALRKKTKSTFRVAARRRCH